MGPSQQSLNPYSCFVSSVKGGDHANKEKSSARQNEVFTNRKTMKGISFTIVGIGASAGGLETLNAFFPIMPPDSNIAFVITDRLKMSLKEW